MKTDTITTSQHTHNMGVMFGVNPVLRVTTEAKNLANLPTLAGGLKRVPRRTGGSVPIEESREHSLWGLVRRTWRCLPDGLEEEHVCILIRTPTLVV